jgi:Dyp-type peroxidase family
MPDDIQGLLNNVAPIRGDDVRYRQLLDDLQCNILSPHRKHRANYFFLGFREDGDARHLTAKYLIGLLARNGLERANVVSAVHSGTSFLPARFIEAARSGCNTPALPTAAEQLALLKDITVTSELKIQRRNGANPVGFATSFLLTRHGSRKLAAPLPDEAFNEGQAARWERLNDPQPPGESGAGDWDARYDDADAVLVVAYDPQRGDAGVEQQKVLQVLRWYLSKHVDLVAEEIGYVLRRESDGHAIESFGFRDGISQPHFFDDGPPEAPLALWSDFAPLTSVLTPDPHGRTPHACGSYIVFRKLRQDVAGFHRQVRTIADRLKRPYADVLAETVGRRPSGEPLVAAGGRALNDFDFSDDQSAQLCPGYAHIRKVNPRGDVKAIYDSARRRIARRGLAFGEFPRRKDGLPDLDAAPGAYPVGMLFLCAQADIAEQFEHLQSHWANNSQIPRGLAPGLDAIAGRAAQQEPARIVARNRNGVLEHVNYQNYVEMRGGAYLFAPSIGFLKALLDDLWA